MPGSNFSTFKRELFWESVVNLCGLITHANGYNTQPLVVTDPRRARSSSKRHTLLVIHGDEEIVNVAVGGCMEVLLTVDSGCSEYNRTEPWRDCRLR